MAVESRLQNRAPAAVTSAERPHKSFFFLFSQLDAERNKRETILDYLTRVIKIFSPLPLARKQNRNIYAVVALWPGNETQKLCWPWSLINLRIRSASKCAGKIAKNYNVLMRCWTTILNGFFFLAFAMWRSVSQEYTSWYNEWLAFNFLFVFHIKTVKCSANENDFSRKTRLPFVMGMLAVMPIDDDLVEIMTIYLHHVMRSDLSMREEIRCLWSNSIFSDAIRLRVVVCVVCCCTQYQNK